MDANKNIVVDIKTEYLGLPLPNGDNCLSDDVGRIIQSFGIIDRELNNVSLSQAKLAKEMLTFSNRLLQVELGQVDDDANNMPVGGYEVGDARITPITILPKGSEPVKGAALTIITEDFEKNT